MNWILARIKEPSTWAGLVTILTVAGVAVSPEMKEAVISAGVGIGGLILVIMKERK